MLKQTYFIFSLLLMLVGCSDKTEEVPLPIESSPQEAIDPPKLTKNEVDYSESFNGIQGCAIFYDPDKFTYDVYNEDICSEQIPPYSTFKIITALMGLSNGVVTSPNSQLGYDGTFYWREQWNKDLTFKEAFQESCVWYFEKLMDALDKDTVIKTLTDLNYGNVDLSAWDDAGHHTYWISSSLKISAFEQVQVLENIFEGKSDFKPEDVAVVKDFMLVDDQKEYSIYGKTGSASQTNAWFVGIVEQNHELMYFAVRIADESQELAGSVAKEIALDIIKKHLLD